MAHVSIYTSDHECLADTATVVTYHPNGMAVWSGKHRQYIVGKPTAIRIPDVQFQFVTSEWSTSLFGQYFTQDIPMAIYLSDANIVDGVGFTQWLFSFKRSKIMPWSDSYYDPPCDECEKCMEAGFEECQCPQDDGYDPLDDPKMFQDDNDGMTLEQTLEVEEWVRNSCSLCGDLCEPIGDDMYCPNCNDEMEREENA